MNQLSIERRTQVVKALVEGSSIRATARMTGVAINTVVKLLIDLGSVCLDFHDEVMRDLPCTRLQCDEVWSFVYAKARNVPTAGAAPPSLRMPPNSATPTMLPR